MRFIVRQPENHPERDYLITSAPDREAAKRNARPKLGGDPDQYIVEPILDGSGPTERHDGLTFQVIRLNKIIRDAQKVIQDGGDLEQVWGALYVPPDLQSPLVPVRESLLEDAYGGPDLSRGDHI